MTDEDAPRSASREPQKVHQCLQADVWEPEAEILLDRIGVEPGWKCADLGSGATGILASLARRVGAGGLVIGIDLSLELARLAGETARLAGQSQRHMVVADLLQPALATASFDLVHTRFTLHLVPPDRAIARMKELAKPGGWVTLEEPDLTSWRYRPESPSWPCLLETLSAVIALDGDPNVGRRLPALLEQAGLRDVEVRPVALRLDAGHPHLRLPLAWLAAQRDVILERAIASAAELEAWTAELESHLADPTVTMVTPTTVQAWGRRP